MTCSRKHLTTAACAVPGGVLHTQLNAAGAIVLRLTQLDPDESLPPTIARELWNALFPYVAAGQSTDAVLELELPLPSTTLHDSLLAIGASLDSPPNYHLSRSALFQLFHYATAATVPPPFPSVSVPTIKGDGQTTVLAHPQRPPKPKPGHDVYSRLVPHLDSFFKLAVVGPNDVGTIHDWLNEPRVDAFWGVSHPLLFAPPPGAQPPACVRAPTPPEPPPRLAPPLPLKTRPS